MTGRLPDIYLKSDLKKLLDYKVVVFLGDSNMRSLYKDLIVLSQENRLISETGLKSKMEPSFKGDQLIYSIKKTNARIYKEERVYKQDGIHLEYYFITRVYDEYVERILNELSDTKPNIVIISSCLWDITRWGPRGVEQYQKNLNLVAKKLKKLLPKDTLVIWLTTLPISQEMRGGVLIPQLEFLKYSLRYHVMEANQYARKVFVSHGFDVLDLHYHLQMQIHLRGKDGIHWLPPAVRYITNLLLTHVSLAWGVSGPGRFKEEMDRIALDQLTNKMLEGDEARCKLQIGNINNIDIRNMQSIEMESDINYNSLFPRENVMNEDIPYYNRNRNIFELNQMVLANQTTRNNINEIRLAYDTRQVVLNPFSVPVVTQRNPKSNNNRKRKRNRTNNRYNKHKHT